MVAQNTVETPRLNRLDADMAELSLLLPSWQLGILEQAAQNEGLTVGQYLRRVVNRTVAQLSVHQPGYYLG